MDTLLGGLAVADAGVGQWGPLLLAGVIWGATGLALAEAIGMTLDPERRGALWRDMRQALPWAAGLASAQLAALGLAIAMDPDNKALGGFAIAYLIFALLFPMLWAVGQSFGASAHMPLRQEAWSGRRTAWTLSTLIGIGFLINLFTIVIPDVRAGETVTDLTKDVEPLALGALAIWLILNAPWQEELILRHYLVARIAHYGSNRGKRRLWTVIAVIIAAAVFSIGHAGHMEPAWPKLLQTFGWGLILGWARVWLGTWYAVGLHLVLNVSAPLFAPFIQTG